MCYLITVIYAFVVFYIYLYNLDLGLRHLIIKHKEYTK